jgi:hypothetical protein
MRSSFSPLLFLEQIGHDFVHSLQSAFIAPCEHGIVVKRPRLIRVIRYLKLLWSEKELAFVLEFDLKDSDEFLVGNAVYRVASGEVHH